MILVLAAQKERVFKNGKRKKKEDKMKKLILIGMILVLVAGAMGMIYNTRQSAQEAFTTHLEEKEAALNNLEISNIKYLNDVECKISEEGETCRVCFSYTYTISLIQTEIKDCTTVNPDFTDKEIDETVLSKINQTVQEEFNSKTFEYERTGFKGRSIK